MGFICVGAQDPDDGTVARSQAIHKHSASWGSGGGPAVGPSEFASGGRGEDLRLKLEFSHNLRETSEKLPIAHYLSGFFPPPTISTI